MGKCAPVGGLVTSQLQLLAGPSLKGRSSAHRCVEVWGDKGISHLHMTRAPLSHGGMLGRPITYTFSLCQGDEG